MAPIGAPSKLEELAVVAAVTDLDEELSGRLVAAGRATLISSFTVALSAAAQAYAPYSSFHVGAVVTSDAGRNFAGCNIENASFSVGTCAERNALAAYVLGRQPAEHLVSLAIVAVLMTPAGPVHAPCSPCGACRQAIMQFAQECDVQFFWGDPLSLATARASELLPATFAL